MERINLQPLFDYLGLNDHVKENTPEARKKKLEEIISVLESMPDFDLSELAEKFEEARKEATRQETEFL